MVSTTARIAPGRGISHLGRIERGQRIAPAEPPRPKRSGPRRLLRWTLLSVVLLVAAALVWIIQARVTATGIVEGEVRRFTAPASVIVEQVYVKPGQWCQKGQPLVRLAALNAQASRGVLEALVQQAQLRLELARLGAELGDLHLAKRLDERDRLAAELEAAVAAVRGAQAESDRARRELAIQAALQQQGHSSTRELDAARTAAATAAAELAEAQAKLDGLRDRLTRQQQLVPADSNAAELRRIELALLASALRQAQQRLRQFDYQSGSRTLVAPFAGRVDRVYVTVGACRQEGEPLLDIYDPASLHVVAYVNPGDQQRFKTGTHVKMYPRGSWQPIAGVVRQVHLGWSRIPASIQKTPGRSRPAVTMRIDPGGPSRARLVPNMVLKIVCTGR